MAFVKDNVATDAMMTYPRTGRLVELDRAIQAEEAALAVLATASPSRPGLLGNLRLCLLLRYRARHAIAATSSGDLIEGLHCAREAIETGGEGVYSAVSAGILASLILQQAVHDPDGADQIEFADKMFRRALAGMTPGDPQRQAAQSQLAQCRALRAIRGSDAAELEGAVGDISAAIDLLSASSPLRAGALGVKADLLLAASVLSGGVDAHVERAVAASRTAVAAAASVSAGTAFTTTRQWGDTMWRLGRLPPRRGAYSAALRLLHDLSRAQLVLLDKDVALSQAADITDRAAIALAYSGRATAAAVAVETGRAVVLSEALGEEQAQGLDVAARLKPDRVETYERAAPRVAELQRRALAATHTGPATPIGSPGGTWAPPLTTLDGNVTAPTVDRGRICARHFNGWPWSQRVWRCLR
jgi:hypothetical protein